MLLGQFMRTYCQDILEKHALREKLLENDYDKPYDGVIYDVSGDPVKVIWCVTGDIPIDDIFGLDKEEFAKVHPSEQAIEAYERYLDNFIILEGEEALLQIRNDMLKELEKIDKYSAMSDDFI